VETEGQNKGGRLVGGEIREMEGSERSLYRFPDAVHFAGGEP